ncbi:proline-rich [Gracilaria domingensis]|nr:proline-rich [Gracilaria domingensis]
MTWMHAAAAGDVTCLHHARAQPCARASEASRAGGHWRLAAHTRDRGEEDGTHGASAGAARGLEGALPWRGGGGADGGGGAGGGKGGESGGGGGRRPSRPPRGVSPGGALHAV